MLKVQYTPTLIFLDETGTPELRVDGYRPPEAFLQLVKDLVAGKQGLPEAAQVSDQVINLDLQGDKPLAIELIANDCSACTEFQQEVLSRDDTQALLSGYRHLQINVSENPELAFADGEKLSADQWARKLGISYLPAWIFFDNTGTEQFRVDAYVRSFHFNSALQYVASGAYKEQPEFQRFIHDQADKLRQSGASLNILE